MADAITIKALQDASLDAKSLEDVVNGDEEKQVTTRLGETYPSVKKAIKTLFENGGLPATPFATKALMTASALVDDKYAMVTDDTVNNGLYVKTAGAWVKSEYDPFSAVEGIKNNLQTVSDYTYNILETREDTEFTHLFTDSNLAVVGLIDNKGEFDITLTDNAKIKNSRVQDDKDNNRAFVVLDPNNKVLVDIPVGYDFYNSNSLYTTNESDEHAFVFIDKDNKVVGTLPNDMVDVGKSSVEEPDDVNKYLLSGFPITEPSSSVELVEMTELIPKMQLNTIAKGRTGSEDIVVNGDGLTHPKMIYVPQGWNGYKYWLAATPTFGVTPDNQYENPHVWASNDLEEWVEPSGGPIDLPEDGNNSYWSDTHLELADDGYLYCWYRGNSFTFTNYGRFVCYKRSRDGVNWSDRVVVYGTDNGEFGVDRNNAIASPAIHRDGSTWVCYDVIRSSEGGLTIPSPDPFQSTFVFRRNGSEVSSSFGKYDIQQVVNYSPIAWGEEYDPWHIDSIKVGNLYIHHIAVGLDDISKSRYSYLAWSKDGWNFNVLPERLNTGSGYDYRSSLTVTKVKGKTIELKVVIAKTTGVLKLYNLTLEVK